jgi:hypothetical protein
MELQLFELHDVELQDVELQLFELHEVELQLFELQDVEFQDMPLQLVELHEVLDQPAFSAIRDDHDVELHVSDDHDVEDHEVESHGSPRTSRSPTRRSRTPSSSRSTSTWKRPRLPSSVPSPVDRISPAFGFATSLVAARTAPVASTRPSPPPTR